MKPALPLYDKESADDRLSQKMLVPCPQSSISLNLPHPFPFLNNETPDKLAISQKTLFSKNHRIRILI